MTISTIETAKVGALARPRAGNEERHARLLPLGGNSAEQHHARRERCAYSNNRHENTSRMSAETRRSAIGRAQHQA
jgi:hypothetical protein